MSKRAEELARAVAKSVSDAIHTPIVLDIYRSAVDLIDDELRKERERCAERASEWLMRRSGAGTFPSGEMWTKSLSAAIQADTP